MKRAAFFVAIVALALWAAGGVLRADTVILQAEDYKIGGEGVGYHDEEETNHGGQYRVLPKDAGVDIEVAYVGGSPVGYNVGWTNGGEWFKMTIDPGSWTQNPYFAESKRYLVRARKAGYGGRFRVDIDGVGAIDDVSNLATGGWQTWDDSVWSITKFPLTAGEHEVTFYVSAGGFNVDYIEFQSTDLDYPAPIPQKLDPITGCYYERIGSQTWDEARVNSASLGKFQGAQGVFAVPENLAESQRMASLGESWIAVTDATEMSSLDGWDPVGTLGTDEGGDESAWPEPLVMPPGYGDRGYGWKRLDGKPLTFQAWSGGEPNNYGGNEDAAQLWSSGRWNDHVAGSSLGNGDYLIPYLAKYSTVLNQGKFKITERKSTGRIDTLADADALLSLPSGSAGILQEVTGEAYAISFQDPDAGGGYANWVRAPFLTDSAADDQHFALKATAQVEIPEVGEWTFAVVHDDYTRLTVDGNTVEAISQVDIDLLFVNFATTGAKPLELVFQECEGGSYVQLLAAKGRWAFNTDLFRLVGDVYGGGLRIVGGAAPHAGDANKDGKVDDLDASILAANWQRTGGAAWEQADFNGDGNVNDLDASILAANWQYGVGAAVPEPATLALLLVGLATLAVARRARGR